MRKAGIVFLAVIILVSSCFGLLHVYLLGVADDVTVSVETLYGDPSAAEGTHILVRNHYSQNLMWETELTLGDGTAPETRFTFSNEPLSVSDEVAYDGVRFNVITSMFSFFDESLPEYTRQKYAELIAVFSENEDAVAKGEYKTFTLDLAEYLDYYPIEGQILLPENALYFSEFDSWTDQSMKIAQKFNEFFKIPVTTTFTVEYDIDKRYNGSSYGASVNSNYYLTAEGTATENACYFSFNTVMEDGSIADTSQIPGGYGIYRLPYDNMGVEPDKLEMVFPLDPKERFDGLSLSGDGNRLRLRTWKDDCLVLTVIDIATMTQLQKFEFPVDTERAYYNVVSYDDFILIEENRNYSEQLDRVIILEELDDGTYRQAISVPVNAAVFPEKSNLNLFSKYDNAVDFADGKLVVLHHRLNEQEYYFTYCDLYVAVYDANGMVYAGSCEWNLTKINEQGRYSERIQPLYNGSLEVSW